MKVLFVVAPEGFRDEELLVPKSKLEAAGHQVKVAGTKHGFAVGMLGARVEIDVRLIDVKKDDYGALVIVGGGGSPVFLWNNLALQDLIRAFELAGKPLAAICLSPPILAKVGVLFGKKATTFPDEKAISLLKENGAIYVDTPVVTSGNIVTAKGPEAAEAFGDEIVRVLS
ncbi:Intracellular protease 1 [uncultured archaeon]|nr:Intracellular protease 1 [uncultured archaeon]